MRCAGTHRSSAIAVRTRIKIMARAKMLRQERSSAQ
jgi:hypothetical protein